jgi:hypothetical protein
MQRIRGNRGWDIPIHDIGYVAFQFRRKFLNDGYFGFVMYFGIEMHIFLKLTSRKTHL